MSLGTALLVMIGVLLILAIAAKEWERYEKNKYEEGLTKKRRIFRRRG